MGGFRVRKSFKVAPGMRLNVTKTGLGMTVGAKGAGPRYSVHSSGRRTVSASTGVSGLYYQKTSSGRASQRSRASAPAAPIASPARPGLFAPSAEKELYRALQSQDAQAMKVVGDRDTEYRVPAYTLAGLFLAGDAADTAKPLLESIFASKQEPTSTPFFQRYMNAHVEISIAGGVTASLPLNRDAVGLTLAEIYQREGELAKAIDVVEQLEPSAYAAVSLAELYVDAERYADVVELTDGVENADDACALLLVFRGIALREQGYTDAAHEAFKEALRSRSRDAAIRHYALSERATNYVAQGKKGMARKDLERILAEDSSYEGVRERLAELESG
jgi:tetratricopeptide (TPR) repeat protein